MKVKFLNDECTEVELTKGFWFWKRKAEVRRDSIGFWVYRSGDPINMLDAAEIEIARIRLERRRQDAVGRRNWKRA